MLYLSWKSLLLLAIISVRQGTTAFGVVGARTTKTPSSSLAAEKIAQNDFSTEQEHIINQAQTFDYMAGLFSNANMLPPEAIAVYKNFASRFLKEITTHTQSTDRSTLDILDVGCGAGVLFPFLLEAANDMNLTLHITGVDLSKQMVQNGRDYAQEVLSKVDGDHTIDVYADDACRFLLQRPKEFDGVIANSCFANFWDQIGCIEAMMTGLRTGGIMVVAHPVGAKFVQGLNQDNPNVTPHLMPSRIEFRDMTSGFPLSVLDFDQEVQMGKDITTPMYYASAVKWD